MKRRIITFIIIWFVLLGGISLTVVTLLKPLALDYVWYNRSVASLGIPEAYAQDNDYTYTLDDVAVMQEWFINLRATYNSDQTDMVRLDNSNQTNVDSFVPTNRFVNLETAYPGVIYEPTQVASAHSASIDYVHYMRVAFVLEYDFNTNIYLIRVQTGPNDNDFAIYRMRIMDGQVLEITHKPPDSLTEQSYEGDVDSEGYPTAVSNILLWQREMLNQRVDITKRIVCPERLDLDNCIQEQSFVQSGPNPGVIDKEYIDDELTRMAIYVDFLISEVRYFDDLYNIEYDNNPVDGTYEYRRSANLNRDTGEFAFAEVSYLPDDMFASGMFPTIPLFWSFFYN